VRSSEAGRVAVIGAGSSGITAAKKLKDFGVPFTCFEAGDRVGGNWVYDNANGMSSAYRSLFINTSRQMMEFADFPMPAHYPDYPHHTQIAAYFEDYVARFGVQEHIRFSTRVEHCEPVARGGWDVTTDDGATEWYAALVVANGHHWDPRLPDIAGHFDGDQIHSHHYRVPDPYAGRRVLVVGFGNSAVDIATETSRVSEMTFLSTRRGAHVIPKYIFGIPTDIFNAGAQRLGLPFAVRRRLYRAVLYLTQGDLTAYGLPRPDHDVTAAHPTISSELLGRIGHGRVAVMPDVARLDGDGVVFTDGRRERVDAIVWCTGYNVTFPFFAPDVIAAPDNDLPLFKRIFHPQRRDVCFVGLFQPLGAIMPIAERQGELIARYLLGDYGLPDDATMRRVIEEDRAWVRRRFYGSPRHTMQVDFWEYMADLRRELRAGLRRGGTALVRPTAPVAPAVADVGATA
jgi:hypothetical protein